MDADILTLSFEDALTELTSVVGKLEQGRVSLEDSVALYERGLLLKKVCEEKLSAAKMRVEQLLLGDDPDAAPQLTPFAELP